MIRTQIQLTKEQFMALKKMSAEKGLSMAELVRLGVAYVLAAEGDVNNEQARQKALQAAGRFRSGIKDLSRNHDDYLAEGPSA